MMRNICLFLALGFVYEGESFDCSYDNTHFKCNNGCCRDDQYTYCCPDLASTTTSFRLSGVAIIGMIMGGIFMVTVIVLLITILHKYKQSAQVKPSTTRSLQEFQMNFSTGERILEEIYGLPPPYASPPPYAQVSTNQLPEIVS